MINEIINQQQKNIVEINKLTIDAKNYAQNAFAQSTLKLYQKEWQFFEKWCEQNNFHSHPCSINTLILYVTHLANANYKYATIQKKIYAIAKIHATTNKHLNLKDANFKLVLDGIKRTIGTLKKGKSPIMITTLRSILIKIDDTYMGIRDKALINFGWASAMRRSEIIALNWPDIEYIDEGLLITIRKSKTDQYGEGQKIAILYGNNPDTCPVSNLKKWQLISTNKEAVFTSINKADIVSNKRLSDYDLVRIIQKRMINAELDHTNFAGHSLRSGFITTAAKHSVPDHIIMKHSRHKTAQMIQVYTRDNSLTKDNATTMVGL